ncbi:HAMP domain-containing histidine kinase [Aestuariibacter sp. AA17]|uniref:HAMP domain-containing histidine kinase n=1 Tax=Fluctibacter corallii TaxID=2984329 RepID=A0ABT3AAD3_9ALTE|nr:HAMP domain-containing sensor histidine kinase [Aestuariibacter sp. AA17]MCV2885271.1 HAMP domain-containing histidine kinase [Aestuariibacter sp. AA17]
MNNERHPIDFSTVLAAAVHDMKNSLCLLSQTIEELSLKVEDSNSVAKNHLATAHYEASRLNTGLVQLLSLYRAEIESLPLNVDECYIEDLIDELLYNNESYAKHKGLTLTVEQSGNLVWYLDRDLVVLLINDVIINAMRYCKSTIQLKIFEENGYIVFQVEDDGKGYPSSMLKATTINIQDFDISHGRTGLGLFFARLIAGAHSTGNRKGEIVLSNGGTLGGSVFTLRLP